MSHLTHKALGTRRLNQGTRLQRPGDLRPVRTDSPAIEVMTDFRLVHPVTTTAASSLAAANDLMIARGVRLLLVTGGEQRLEGLITARDTLGERPLQILHQRGGNHADLRVADLMRRVEEIDIVDIGDVLHAEVGDIVITLKSLGRQHLLVGAADPESGGYQVRGVFSATQIGRQLGVALQPFEVAHTFAEIEAVLAVG